MGMFDYVNHRGTSCSKCGCELTEWQTKDAARNFDTVEPSSVQYFYTSCNNCHTWFDYHREGSLFQCYPEGSETPIACFKVPDLRLALRRCATAVGATVGEQCTDEFHAFVAEEVELVVAKLRKRITQLEAELTKLKEKHA